MRHASATSLGLWSQFAEELDGVGGVADGIDDGPEEIAAALNAMFADSGSSRPAARRFEVTNPEPDHAYIEFTGDLAGEPQSLLTVSVHSFAPGVVTFTLDLARAELASALRETAQIELPFEVELEVVDDDENAADPAVPGRLITLFQLPVKIAREQIWEELADVPAIDWLRPPQPRDYIPFTPDQIITGAQHYVAMIGDGVQRSFSLAHNLGTEALHVTVRENSPGGRRLRDAEFTASFSSANELVLEFPGTNLEDITWLATPLLSQRLIVSSLNLKHHFGCAIKRDSIGALAADRLLYNVWEAAPLAPTNANFTLRARLTQFDTENSVTGARGLVSYALTEAAGEIS